MNIYKENGYESRRDYLQCIAEDYGVSQQVVFMLADVLGPNEDFDGLVTEIIDYAEDQAYEVA